MENLGRVASAAVPTPVQVGLSAWRLWPFVYDSLASQIPLFHLGRNKRWAALHFSFYLSPLPASPSYLCLGLSIGHLGQVYQAIRSHLSIYQHGLHCPELCPLMSVEKKNKQTNKQQTIKPHMLRCSLKMFSCQLERVSKFHIQKVPAIHPSKQYSCPMLVRERRMDASLKPALKSP